MQTWRRKRVRVVAAVHQEVDHVTTEHGLVDQPRHFDHLVDEADRRWDLLPLGEGELGDDPFARALASLVRPTTTVPSSAECASRPRGRDAAGTRTDRP
jgi:hypothetical protein